MGLLRRFPPSLRPGLENSRGARQYIWHGTRVPARRGHGCGRKRRHRRDRSRRPAPGARARVRRPPRADRSCTGRRAAQEHGVATPERARAQRPRRAAGSARALPRGPRCAALRRPRPRGTEPRRARGAPDGRARRRHGGDDQPRRAGPRRRRAPRPGRGQALPRHDAVGRPQRALPLLGERQDLARLRRRPHAARRPARAAHLADDRGPAAAPGGARDDPPRRLRGGNRRARARPLRRRGAGLRREGPCGGGAQCLRSHAEADAEADRGAAPDSDQAVPGALEAARSPSGRSARGMTHEEILTALYEDTLVGNAPAVKENVEKGLEDGMDPGAMLYDALIPSLEEVGARFERGDYFVPEMLIAARAMQGALDILRPLLAETGAKPVGTFVMGTVKGDVHDIGKNLCNIMLEGAGFTVIDLGVNVAPETFVEQVNEHEPDIVGFSAFLTTTMPMFKANINALEKAGIREKVAVMVGGAPVTQEYADAVGADGYSADASSAVKKAKELVERRRGAAVPA